MTGLATATVVAHARKLVSAGAVKRSKEGARIRHFLATQEIPPRPLPKSWEPLTAYMVRQGEATFPELMAAFPDVPRSTLQYRLERLSDLKAFALPAKRK